MAHLRCRQNAPVDEAAAASTRLFVTPFAVWVVQRRPPAGCAGHSATSFFVVLAMSSHHHRAGVFYWRMNLLSAGRMKSSGCCCCSLLRPDLSWINCWFSDATVRLPSAVQVKTRSAGATPFRSGAFRPVFGFKLPAHAGVWGWAFLRHTFCGWPHGLAALPNLSSPRNSTVVAQASRLAEKIQFRRPGPGPNSGCKSVSWLPAEGMKPWCVITR